MLMTSGWVRLDGDDIVTGQSLSSSGVIFDLVLNADFQGSGAGEYVVATGGSVVDGAKASWRAAGRHL